MKERLKAIWHILTDKEYIVFTLTVKNGERKRCSALISDSASNILIMTAIDILTDIETKKDEGK